MFSERARQTEVETTHGMMTLPNDYEEKWFVFFSHPGNFTPVCTTGAEVRPARWAHRSVGGSGVFSPGPV